MLAAPHQMEALQRVLGEALCAAPSEHEGPCRIAWSMSYLTEDLCDGDGDDAADTDGFDADHIRETLTQVPVWPTADVDRNLGISPRA